MTKNNYTPLMFLASLWAWWMSVTFFMYLMFIIPRDKDTYVIPTFDSLQIAWLNPNIFFKILIVLSILWIIFFAFKHIQLLIWNLKNYFSFRKTKEFGEMTNSVTEINLMAMPLTLAMTINVLFILWAVFIPWLWTIVEYLFPFAIIAFLSVWILWLKIFSDYFVKLILKKWNADFTNNNNLSQMLSVFAFTMVWVGFAAPAAMSQNDITILLWIIWSIFFITIASFLLLLKIILGFKAIFEHGIDKAASPSLWIIIPILTLIWISLVRQTHGLHSFWLHTASADFIVLTTTIISLQIIFWYLWYKVMKSNNYFKDFVYWKEKNPWSYALICPGVALFVFSGLM